MKEKNDRLMTLPEKDFYSIEEVAAEWSRKTNKTVLIKHILDYIKQGILPAYIYYHNTYSLVQKHQLTDFANLIRGKVDIYSSVPAPLGPQTSNLHGWTFDSSGDNIYIKNENLKNFEKEHTGKGLKMQPKEEDKLLTTKERNSLSIIIMSLAKLADIDTEKSSKAADVIKFQAEELGLNISPNTIRKFLKEARKVLHPK